MSLRLRSLLLMVAALAACAEPGFSPPKQISTVNPPVLAPSIGVDSVTGASIETDQDDYSPGEVVHVAGKGWAPGETVNLHMTEEPDTHGPVSMDVTADSVGVFSVHFYDVQVHDIGSVFTLTATGRSSGSSAVAVFTDGIIDAASVTSSLRNAACSGTITQGIVGQELCMRLTFNITGTGSTNYQVRWIRPDNVLHEIDGGSTNPPSSGVVFAPKSVPNIPGTWRIRLCESASGVINATCNPSGTEKYTTTFDVVVGAPNLTITKTATNQNAANLDGDPDVQAGASAEFTFVVTNSGTAATSGAVTVTDTIPSSLTYTGFASTTPGWSCALTVVDSFNRVSCTSSNVIPFTAGNNTSTVKITATANAAGPDRTNTAWVAGGGDNTSAGDTETFDIIGQADLAVTKSHTGSFTAGMTGSYTIQVNNVGTAPAPIGFTMTDVLPAGTTFASLAEPAGFTCTTPAAGASGTVTCTATAALAAGASASFTLVVNVASNAGTPITNTATVSGAGDTNGANDSASDQTTIVYASDLSIDKSHTGNFTFGTNGSYAIAVTNNGPSAKPAGVSVTVTDVLPATLSYVSATGTGWTCGQSAGTVTCTRSDALAVGAAYPSITLTVAPTNAGSASNTASVAIGTGATDPDASDDSDTDPTTIDPAATTTSIAISPTSQQYSDKVDFTATITPAQVLSEILTGTVQFKVAGSNVGAAQAITCDVSLPAPDNECTATYTYQVSSAASPPTLAVSAVFTSTNANFAGSSTTASATLTVTKEDASGAFDSSNPDQVLSTATTFDLKVTFRETSPEKNAEVERGEGTVNPTTMPAITMRLTGQGTNTSYTGDCSAVSPVYGGAGYDGTATFTCRFGGGPFTPDIYVIQSQLTGNHFTGAAEDLLALWDPNAGFATGGGKFLLDGDRVNFGFSYTVTKGRTTPRGGLVVIRHLASGGVCRLKSNALDLPAVGTIPGTTYGYVTLNGRGTYSCVDAFGVAIPNAGQGNLDITAYAEDRATSGAGYDRFWVTSSAPALMGPAGSTQHMNTLKMAGPGNDPARNKVVTGGNIQIPHAGGGAP
jgi:uncharacterized repeat protein (TIGR01451 family)